MKTTQLDIIFAIILSLSVCGTYLPQIIYVAKDGTGQYNTIGAAIAASPNYSTSRTYIKVKPGIYRENIVVPEIKTMLTLIGYGMYKTIVSGDRSNGSGFHTDKTATADIYGQNFLAVDITIENTAGAANQQAVALKSEAQSTFYRCRFLGYQDTLYAKAGMQFYRDCEIFGTVDFIFGNAAVVFQNCRIFALEPLPGQLNTITAQGRDNSKEEVGTIFHNCTILGAVDLQGSVKTYFGRPWRFYSRVVIMQSEIHPLIDPQGWMKWDDTSPLDKLFYAEYDNRGTGADTSRRVTWPGRVLLNTTAQANYYTVRNFISGEKWIPATVPRFLDLI
ncbi:pectinesterase 2-like [Impatiens glandulifera]|uniref:pectinesterase 2-like n=1 Tax=Impatiens glandulifera TaxID=253017 RepID=UPI001FB0CBE4|nr:pectinesterase 2-like [Impatiens glandulifera]